MKLLSPIAVALVTIASWVFLTPFAMAIMADNVYNSRHNFSGNASGGQASTQYTGEFNETCKYCHTPHNAESRGPLWSKVNSNEASAPGYYRLYTSSQSLTSVTKHATLTPDSPSLLCLGCHDGKTAMNVTHSSDATGGDAPTTIVNGAPSYPAGTKFIMYQGNSGPLPLSDGPSTFNLPGRGFNLGKAADGSNDSQGNDLTNDHPIGFDYNAAQGLSLGALYAIGTINSRIKFYGPNHKVECTTCHNPHANDDDVDLRPMLVISNIGSALCLSCHNK